MNADLQTLLDLAARLTSPPPPPPAADEEDAPMSSTAGASSSAASAPSSSSASSASSFLLPRTGLHQSLSSLLSCHRELMVKTMGGLMVADEQAIALRQLQSSARELNMERHQMRATQEQFVATVQKEAQEQVQAVTALCCATIQAHEAQVQQKEQQLSQLQDEQDKLRTRIVDTNDEIKRTRVSKQALAAVEANNFMKALLPD
jgi:septal ring factor EnvC (AmiA/AmiB activator)